MKEHLLLIEHFEDLNRIDLIINESFLVEYNSHTTLNIAEIEEIFKAAAKYVENGAVQDVIAGTKAQSKKVLAHASTPLGKAPAPNVQPPE